MGNICPSARLFPMTTEKRRKKRRAGEGECVQQPLFCCLSVRTRVCVCQYTVRVRVDHQKTSEKWASCSLFSSLSLLLCIHRREKLLFYRYTHTLTSIRAVRFSLDSDIETTTTTTLIVMTTTTRRLVTSESLRKGRKKKRFSLWFKGFFFPIFPFTSSTTTTTTSWGAVQKVIDDSVQLSSLSLSLHTKR